MASKKAKKVSKVMGEFKAGTLHSGKGGPVVKSKRQAVAIAISEGNRAAKAPKGYHRMPNGKLMKGATHKEGARHERTESKAEKRAEYGPKPKKKISQTRKNNMDY